MKSKKKIYILDDELHLLENKKEIVIKNSNYFHHGKITDIKKTIPYLKNEFEVQQIKIGFIQEEITILINYNYTSVEKELIQTLFERLEFSKITFEYEEEYINNNYNLIIKYNQNHSIIINRKTTDYFEINHNIFKNTKTLNEEDIIIDFLKENGKKSLLFIYGNNPKIKSLSNKIETNLGLKSYYPANLNSHFTDIEV